MGVPLFAAVSFITGALLLVIGVNVLGLLLGRVSRRGRSVGLAMAIGAGRRVLLLQHLTEYLLTGLAGGALGIGAAALLTAVVQGRLNPEGAALPGLRLALQPATVALSAGLVLGLNLVLGLVPALQASRTRAADALRME